MASKFEFEGYVYEQNDKGNRFYRWLSGEPASTKKRISEEAFEDAFDNYWDEDYKEKKAKEKADDKKAEDAVNGKRAKSKKNKKERGLTEKQEDFIKHIPDCSFYEDGLKSMIYTDVLSDEIGGQFAGKPMTVGAMISTLREKGIVDIQMDRINGKKAKIMSFTKEGQKIAKDLGLK